MREIRYETRIDATPERVWEVFTDFGNYHTWNPFIVKASGEPRVGETIQVTIKAPAGIEEYAPRIKDVQPGSSLTCGPAIPGMFDREIAFNIWAEGPRTVFSHTARLKGLFVGVRSATIEQLEMGYRTMNSALKDQCERDPASG